MEEIRSINQQNCFIVLTRLVFLVSHSTILWWKHDEFLAIILSESLYCFGSCFIINYYFFVHHRVFKKTKAKLRLTSRDQLSSSKRETLLQIETLTVAVSVDKESIPNDSIHDPETTFTSNLPPQSEAESENICSKTERIQLSGSALV